MEKKYFIISHNEFAHGLKKALEMIIGPQENVESFGLMPGNHPDLIIDEIESKITDEMDVVILGDIAGGSVCNSALRLTTKQNVLLVTGVNLALALEVIVSQTTDEQAIESLIRSSREGMKILNVVPAKEEGLDDFF